MAFMIKTVVCKREGCSGNEFYIETIENKLKLVCKECRTEILIDINNNEFIMLPHCSECNNDVFKLFMDIENKKVYVKCTKCGAPPEMVYIDDDGVQVTYEVKLLQSIKLLMNRLDQRMCNLEVKLDALEKGQDILEESLAYINNYIVSDKSN